MAFYPKTHDELMQYLESEVSPDGARGALAAIFVCLYGTAEGDDSISFATEKEWDCQVVCNVDDELRTIGPRCDQPNRDGA